MLLDICHGMHKRRVARLRSSTCWPTDDAAAHLVSGKRRGKPGLQLLAALLRAARLGAGSGRSCLCLCGLREQPLLLVLEQTFDALHLLLYPLEAGIFVLYRMLVPTSMLYA